MSNEEYSLPGILNWLQRQHRLIEKERNEWQIERQELNARISLLEGDGVSIERQNSDLSKRIIMYSIY
jgi:striatin 1/3/4